MTFATAILAVAVGVSVLRTVADAVRTRRLTSDLAAYRAQMGDY